MNRSPKLPSKPSSDRQAKQPEQATDTNLAAASSATPSSEIAVSSEIAETLDPTATPDPARQQPIPPPSEPRQYRAIGLIRGQYMPSAEQFTRGTLVAADETLIDAVLLGRVMSLVKNHLDLSQPHLWVVYPRTRQENGNLHVQIVGVWEPEQLSKVRAADGEAEEAEAAKDAQAQEEQDAATTEFKDGYFSIRGEVIYQGRDRDSLVVKIKQAPRKEADKPKFFKLKLDGKVSEKAVGHFWDLQVQRQGDALVVQSATDIGIVPVNKRSKFAKKRPFVKKYPPQQRDRSDRPERPSRPNTGDRPAAIAPPKKRDVPKPIKKTQTGDSGGS